MSITNEQQAQISYRHKNEIQHLFKNYVKGDLAIDHFSLNIFFGNGQSIFLSPTPEMANKLCRYGFVNQDSNYDPDIYKRFSLYPWRSVQKNETDRVINFIKEERFQMRSGIMIVRDLGEGRYVMYSVATHKRDNPDFPGQFYFLFHCKANYIAQMGDFLYDNLLPTIQEYGHQTGIHMPKLDYFKPLNLESSFLTQEQYDMFEFLKNGTHTDLKKILKKRDSSVLKLNNNGKIGEY